ncbi:PREDICTED: uncharacterized protein LOC105567983 [Vollenhovia emeryi]|uniref:uncharacterized protein LOC105567983 n=1 Tax=Vollenhovia emeryi TaxID=411798 RepID=UPI0005F3C88B|nr:PREDICTED: uncharacterized protein LOC105567983 [Vollenhovia emeryi]
MGVIIGKAHLLISVYGSLDPAGVLEVYKDCRFNSKIAKFADAFYTNRGGYATVLNVASLNVFANIGSAPQPDCCSSQLTPRRNTICFNFTITMPRCFHTENLVIKFVYVHVRVLIIKESRTPDRLHMRSFAPECSHIKAALWYSDSVRNETKYNGYQIHGLCFGSI